MNFVLKHTQNTLSNLQKWFLLFTLEVNEDTPDLRCCCLFTFQIRVINPENSADKVAEMRDLLMFVDMLKGMLELDATKRITPRQALEHPFISMSHMVRMYPLSSQ